MAVTPQVAFPSVSKSSDCVTEHCLKLLLPMAGRRTMARRGATGADNGWRLPSLIVLCSVRSDARRTGRHTFACHRNLLVYLIYKSHVLQ